MKRIDYSRQFEKAFARRIAHDTKLVRMFDERYLLFEAGERGYPLYDHALTGSRKGQRAFSVSNDLRIIYVETDEAIVFVDIGSHNQVY